MQHFENFNQYKIDRDNITKDDRIDYLRQIIIKKYQKIVEIGPGPGYWTEAIKKVSENVVLELIEPDITAALELKKLGYKVYSGTVEEYLANEKVIENTLFIGICVGNYLDIRYLVEMAEKYKFDLILLQNHSINYYINKIKKGLLNFKTRFIKDGLAAVINGLRPYQKGRDRILEIDCIKLRSKIKYEKEKNSINELNFKNGENARITKK